MEKLLCLVAALACVIGSPTLAVPHAINYQGNLYDAADNPVVGSHVFTFTLFDASSGGTQLWQETQSIELQNGLFSVTLGSVVPLNLDFSDAYFLQISIDGEVLTPRQPLTSVGQAYRSENAEDVYGQDINPNSIAILGFGPVIDQNGDWVGNPTGLIGPSGPVGPQGATGIQGPQGLQGATGPQGVIGPSGPMGVQGTTGPQGLRGYTGVQGPQGATGPQGVQGSTGIQGPQGIQGITGPQGPQGVQGTTGPQGVQGVTGPLGPQGIQGVTGPVGPQGVQGFTGVQGIRGPSGPSGPQGLRGYTGVQGPAGATGVQGAVGPAGPQGLQGVQGDTGVMGLQGIQGETGPLGPTGLQGPIGPTGLQGPQGDTGPVAGLNKQVIYNDNGVAAGAELYYDNATGRLGLGTDSPMYDLDIVGTLAVSGNYRVINPDTNLATLTLTSNQILILTPGIYELSAPLNLVADAITIAGSAGVVLKKSGSLPINAITVSANYCKVIDVEIDGNSVGGAGLLVYGHHNEIRNVYSHHNGGQGLAIDGQATPGHSNLVQGCTASSNSGVGIAMNQAADSRLIDNLCTDNGLEGLTIANQSHRSIVTGNRINNNCLSGGVAAIGIDFSDLCTISNNVITATATCGGMKTQNSVGPSNYNNFSGNVVTANGGYGIWLYTNGTNGSGRWTVSSNICKDNAGYEIRLEAGCENNVVFGNIINGEAVSNAGVNNLIGYNR